MSNGKIVYSDVTGGPVEQSSIESGVYGTLLDFELRKSGSLTPEQQAVQEAYGQYVPYMSPKLPKVVGKLDEKVVCWDCEATGLNPWEYQWLVATFWPLDEPKADMVTFADFNQEDLSREVAEYLNSFDEIAMTGFNVAYDIRCMTSRFMLYQIPCPVLYSCKYYDTREYFRKGVWSNINSDQPTGSLENWGTFLYDEAKPYTVEECMAAVLEEDLEPFIIRNRWDVAVEGDMFLLSKYIETGELFTSSAIKPTEPQREEAKAEGLIVTKCPVCSSYNEYDLTKDSISCYVCGSTIPRPAQAQWLVERVRELAMPASSIKSASKSNV